MMKADKFPPGWDEERVRRVLKHYEAQSEEEAVAEDEAAYEDSSQTFMEIPNTLVPKVRELIAKHTRFARHRYGKSGSFHRNRSLQRKWL